MSNSSKQNQLGLLTQIAYGAADFGPSMAGNILIVFFFFFLTNVARLPANLAGTILLLSNCWSAVSTLVVGTLSDRTQSKWGRRRIWMLCSAPILAISFFLLWWVPPFDNLFKFCYYLAIALLFQTAASAFMVPYGALVTDLTDDHHEHIRLNSMRFGFSLAGCIGSLIIAQGLTYWVLNPRERLFKLGLICAILTIATIYSCCWQIDERPRIIMPKCKFNWQELKSILSNQPLLLLIGIYSLSWLSIQLIPAMLPYFVTNCLKQDGTAVTQMVLIMQGTALGALFIWEPLSKQLEKKVVYWIGTSLWIVAEIGIFQLKSGQNNLMYGLAAIAGLGMATAYFIPSSMLPEVIDWDELHTGKRREGLFYSILMFLFQITFAVGLFFVGQWLDFSGFQEAIPGPLKLPQPQSALTAIRQAIVILPTLALTVSLVFTYFYPIDREVHQDTVFQLQKRRLLSSAQEKVLSAEG
jgi:GPH family glycoside/pentoside/hexuronide:cation symporter